MTETVSTPLASIDQMRQSLRRIAHPKGRQAQEEAVAQVRELIGERPPEGYPRELLIEYLHRINDAMGALPRRHLVALAREMKLGMAQVYEVASFYHHFEVIEDDQEAPALTVRVCQGLSCRMAGAPDVAAIQGPWDRRCAWSRRRASGAANRRRRRWWGSGPSVT